MATYTQNISTALANDSVTNAKLANMAQGTIKGRAAAAGTGDPQDLTPDQASTILDGATDPFVRTSDLPAGGVSSVGATYPIQSSGGATPTISAAISTGGNGSADGGKLVRFRADGEIYFSNNSGSSPSISALSTGAGDGIYSSADAGDGVMAVSNTGKAVHAIAAGNEPAVHANGQGTAPALEVEQNGAGGTDIATFHDGTGDGLTVLTDGGLAWRSATGSRTTTNALQLFDDTEQGLVPASGGGTTNFLRADGTWASPGGGGGGISDGDVLAIGLTFPANGLKIQESGGGSDVLTLRMNEALTADRVLNIKLNDADRSLTIAADTTISGTNTGDETTTTLGSKINGATEKTTPVDADMVGLMDSAASNILKKLSWANIKSGLWSAWGELINGGTSKATPVDADALAIMDSAATNATKKLTWANLKATLKTYFDTLYVLSANELVGVLGSTQSTTSTTLVDCTGLSVSVAANSTYQIEGFILFQSTNATNGVGVSLKGPASPTEIAFNIQLARTASTGLNSNAKAYDEFTAMVDVGAANTTYLAVMNGALVNGANAGTLQVRFASETGGATAKIMAGSSIRLKKVA